MMNDLGLLMIGGMVRVTVLSAFGMALSIAFRRRGPMLGSFLSLTTLTGLLLVSALSIGPGPTFWRFSLPETDTEARASVANDLEPTSEVEHSIQPDRSSWLKLFAAEFARELRGVEATPTSLTLEQSHPRSVVAAWRWPTWFACLGLLFWIFGVARLGFAWLGVRELRQTSLPIRDKRLNEKIDRLRAELGLAKTVEARVSTVLTTPATIGWFKPLILLPKDWRTWTETESRSVLAHELVHIQRADYLSGLWAQVCLAFHAYHPFAHCLMHRFRLEQELAADAVGARLSGGNRPYLEALARLALRQSEPLAAWPVRPFLPTHGTFLRRIEMLRDPKVPETRPTGLLGRAASLILIASTALFLTGLRGPLAAMPLEEKTPSTFATTLAASAETEEQIPTAKAFDVLDLSRVPSDVDGVVLAQPAEALKRPGSQGFVDLAKMSNGISKTFNLPLDQLEAFAVYLTNEATAQSPIPFEPFSILIRSTQVQDWKTIAGKFIKNTENVSHAGKTYMRQMDEPHPPAYAVIDERTLLFGQESNVRKILDARNGPPVAHAWSEPWSRLERKPYGLAAVIDTKRRLKYLPPQEQASISGFAGPLIHKVGAYGLTIELENPGLTIHALMSTSSATDAKAVSETSTALLVLARNAFDQFKQTNQKDQGSGAKLANILIPLADTLLHDVKSEVDGNLVSLTTKSNTDLVATAKALLPAVAAARSVARHAQSVNNMKQIGLAMHNYEAAEGHFPAASILSKGSKFPHSWRVAILPYIERSDLYKEYDFNEPWDSPKNLKLVPKIPNIYLHPLADRNKGFSSYYVFTGPDTLFPANSAGTRMQDVTDGLSNTILTIEANRETPWTKPEDIAYAPINPADPAVPAIKSFGDDQLTIGIADGSVRRFSKLNPAVFKALITRSGGEIVDWNTIP